VYRNLHRFRAEGSFEGWIRRIFVNTAIEHYRRKSAVLANLSEREQNSIEDADITLWTSFQKGYNSDHPELAPIQDRI
jgi:RNA polymerase sigma-70 factor (ECF subfamily)